MDRTGNLGSLLDEVVPEYDVSEVHSVWVSASPDLAYAAVKAVTAKEVRLFAPLMAIRTLVQRLKSEQVDFSPRTPLVEEFLCHGFLILGERPDDEFVIGAIGRFWRVVGDEPRSILSCEEFLAFDEPGYSKVAMNFIVRGEGRGSRIVTETRIVGTSASATKLFGRYWSVIKWGSSAIRRSWLSAIRRRLTED